MKWQWLHLAPITSFNPILHHSSFSPPTPTLSSSSFCRWSYLATLFKARRALPSLTHRRLSDHNASGQLQPRMPSMASFGGLVNEAGLAPRSSYKWQRVLLKVSGEALAGDHTQNIDPKVTMAIAREVASVTRLWR